MSPPRPSTRKPASEPKLSRLHAPPELSAEAWQRELRRQFGSEQPFRMTNLGPERFFSEFRVDNPQSASSYRVAIRGAGAGDNYCACPDFATNDLGTCKHIEFVLARLRRQRGAKAAFAQGWQRPYSELWLRYGAQRSVCFRVGADCPPTVRKAAARLFSPMEDLPSGHLPSGHLPPERFGAIDAFIAAVAKSGHELRAYDDALAFIAGHRDALHRARVLAGAYGRDAPARLAKLLKLPLYPYQVEGALFAARAGRALIGDDMGLGKTAQAICAMQIMARHFGVGRVLVVCPASLKYQWQSEIARFSSRASRVIAGGRPHRAEAFEQDDFCKITNYEKLKPDLDLIAAWSPELVIVDEAQRIKNWNTVAARALKRIDSPYAIVLTGTPLENRLEELISIVQFVDQHRLGPTWKLLHAHQQRDEKGRVVGYRNLDRIAATLAPVMLRRRKADVALQLPDRTDQQLLVPMTGPQWEIHDENVKTVAQIVKRWQRMKFLSEADQRRLTCALQNMRMCCISTWLMDGKTDHGVRADELIALLDDMLDDPQGEKAVVFSQWTGTQDIVARRLKQRGIGHVCFHGGIASEARPALIQRFREDPACRIFLSTDAGAAGLNLQVASLLVNMDPPWNPAVLEQRIGRIHRMGQTRPVRVINFIAKGTIEEAMLSTLAFKRSLATGILDGGPSEITLGGSRLTRFMKDVQAVTAGIDPARTPADEDGPGVNADADTNADGDADPAAMPASGDTPAVATIETPGPDDAPREPLAASAEAPSNAEAPSSAGAPSTAAAPAASPWDVLLQAGNALIAALQTEPEPADRSARRNGSPGWIDHDPDTGARRLVIPVPPPETVRRLADAFAEIAAAIGGRGRS